jgi:hypothetical protein
MSLSLRTGTSLLELVMALSITAIIVIMVTGLLTRQQHLYSALDDALQAFPQRHDAAALLGADIRTMTTLVTPAAIASDSAFDIAATIGASTTCAAGTSTRLWIPPRAEDLNGTLTAWLSLPDSTDELLVYHDDVQPARWDAYPIADIQARALTVCTGLSGPFLDASASEAPAYEINLAMPIPYAVRAGTPIRFVRYGRYNVYRASDGAWYIGYRHCTATHACDGVQPLVGPLAKGSTAPATFKFFASNGTRIPTNGSLANLARVDITLHHATALIPGIDANQHGNLADSIVTSIALRNHQ